MLIEPGASVRDAVLPPAVMRVKYFHDWERGMVLPANAEATVELLLQYADKGECHVVCRKLVLRASRTRKATAIEDEP
jgi:hypothetical protein